MGPEIASVLVSFVVDCAAGSEALGVMALATSLTSLLLRTT